MGKKILVAEDEVIIAEELAMTLERLGYDVVGKAVSGEEVVKLTEKYNPDLVLMDIKLKGMDGIDTAARIKENTNVVYMTAHADQQILSKAVNVPFPLISKPFSDEQLYSSVELALAQGQSGASHEVRKLEERILQHKVLKTIGSMAGGIAHDLNNRLAAIMGYASLIRSQLDDSSPFYPDLNDILTSTRDATDLVEKLLLFARKGNYSFVPLKVNKLIADTRDLFNIVTDRKYDVAVRSNVSDSSTVYADKSKLMDALKHMLENAKEAIGDSGEIYVDVKTVNFSDSDCSRLNIERPGKYVSISITDTGHGISSDLQDEIFNPFFSTKGDPIVDQRGWGLSQVYGIVENHNGGISVYSEPGVGSTFRVYLPLFSESDDDTGNVVDSPVKGNGQKILVVDDSDVNRNMAVRFLEQLNYQTVSAVNGNEAIQLYKSEGQDISMVLLDLIMPDTDGYETYNQIIKMDPKARVLLMTGYGELHSLAQSTMEKGCDGFIQKPFSITDLSHKVNEVMYKQKE